MLHKLIEKMTGRDDLERVAYQNDLEQLNAYLKKRKVLIPQRPKRFLDASNFTQEQLLEQIRQAAQEMSHDPFEPWILEVDGTKRLPAFSSKERLHEFAARISKEIKKVFPIGAAEFLLADITKSFDIDFINLNLFSRKSWEIGVRDQRP